MADRCTPDSGEQAPDQPTDGAADRRRRGKQVWEVVIRDRRWISLTCTAAAGNVRPIRAHVRAALLSGDISAAELREFDLHVAVYAGWPRDQFVGAVIDEVVAEATASDDT